MRDVRDLLEVPMDRAYLNEWVSRLGLAALLKEAMASLAPGLGEREQRRELCRRFYGEELALAVFPESENPAIDASASRPGY